MRGAGRGNRAEDRWSQNPCAPGPDARMTATPARPDPEARAMIVCRWGGRRAMNFTGGRRSACTGSSEHYNPSPQTIQNGSHSMGRSWFQPSRARTGLSGPMSPRQQRQAPAIVVIQEIFGVNEVMRDTSDRLAGEGYAGMPGPVLADRAWHRHHRQDRRGMGESVPAASRPSTSIPACRTSPRQSPGCARRAHPSRSARWAIASAACSPS